MDQLLGEPEAATQAEINSFIALLCVILQRIAEEEQEAAA